MHNTGVQILVVRKQPDNDESDPIKRKYNNNCENSECNTSCDMHPDDELCACQCGVMRY